MVYFREWRAHTILFYVLLRYINSANSVIGLILCCVVMFNFVLCEFCDTSVTLHELFCSDDLISLRARRVNVRFVRVLGRGKHIFKDSVRLIARSYSRSECDSLCRLKLCKWNTHSAIHSLQTFRSHFCLQVIHIFKTVLRIFTAPLRFLTYFWQTKREGCVMRCVCTCDEMWCYVYVCSVCTYLCAVNYGWLSVFLCSLVLWCVVLCYFNNVLTYSNVRQRDLWKHWHKSQQTWTANTESQYHHAVNQQNTRPNLAWTARICRTPRLHGVLLWHVQSQWRHFSTVCIMAKVKATK